MTLPNLALLAAKAPAGGGGGATITYVGSRNDGTMAEPAGVVEGDLVIAVPRSQFGPDQTVTPPAAYTAIHPFTELNSGSEPVGVYWAIRGASALSSSWSYSIGATSPIMVAYRDVDTTTPINASSVTTASGSTITFASITTTVSNCMIVGVLGALDYITMSSPTFSTARVNGTSGARCHAWDDGLQASVGASGANTVTGNFTGNHAAVHIALAPA